MDHLPLLDDETLQRLYAWIDEIPLSRPKKCIARDFSDGILTAEVIAYYFPKLVQMHNYSSANSIKQKQYNWNTLNRKVLKRLHIYLSKDEIDDLVSCRTGAVEHLLVKLQLKIANYREKRPPPSSAGTRAYGAAASSPNYENNDDALMLDSKSSELREPQYRDSISGHEAADYDSNAGVHAPGLGAPSPIAVAAAPVSEHSSTADDRSELLLEKDNTISELRETIQILEMKVQKLEQLVRLKDGKIQTLMAKMRSQKPHQ